MSTVNLDKLEELMKAEKWPEAKKMLDDYFTDTKDPAERGKEHVTYARLYLQVMTRLNNQYLSVLEEGVDALKALDAAESSS